MILGAPALDEQGIEFPFTVHNDEQRRSLLWLSIPIRENEEDEVLNG